MGPRREEQGPCKKRSEYNFLWKWTFSYLSELFRRGSARTLELSDYPEIEDEDASRNLSDKLCKDWEKESKKSNPKLYRSLIRVLGPTYMISGIAYLIEVGFKLGEALSLGRLLNWFSNPEGDMNIV